MDYSFWQKQGSEALFPEIEWNKPEQKGQAGHLVIFGGNKLNFAAIPMNFAKAVQTGVGEVKVLMPDALKGSIPSNPSTFFAKSNASGGFAAEAGAELVAMAHWADCTLLIGDMGRNSETTILMEGFLRERGRVVVTRDSVDLVINAASALVERDETMVILSFAQLQKLFREVYYPKVLTFSMQLTNLVEAVHKFTITYPVTVATLHQDTFVVACGGQVVTTPLGATRYNPMTLWGGEVAVKAAVYWIWNGGKPLEAVASAIL